MLRAVVLLLAAALSSAPRDLRRERQLAHRSIKQGLDSSPAVKAAATRLARLVSMVGLKRPTGAGLGMIRSKWTGIANAVALIPATVEDIWQHIDEAHGTVHVLAAAHTSPLAHMPSVHGPPEHMPRVRVRTSMALRCGGS